MRLASKSRRPRLALESLERRDTPDGKVTAAVASGVLTLTGDDLDNSIQVAQTGAGAFTVSGVNTTIDGGPTFTGVSSIVADFADGNDVVSLFSTADQDSDGVPDFVLPGPVNIDAGDGNSTFGLTAPGKIQVAAFTYTAGDGADLVQVIGGADKESTIAGNLAVAVGIGFNSQGPNYQDTVINLTNLAVGGAGGVKVTGADGPEQLTLTGVTVARALSADGGADNLTVVTNGGSYGSMGLKSAGPSAGYSTNALTLTAAGTRVTGPVSMKSATGAALYLSGAETGPITLTSGNGSSGGAFVEVDPGASAVHGNLQVKGSRLSVYTRSGATLAVDRTLSLVGTGFVDVGITNGSSVTAGAVTLTGTHGAGFSANVGASASRILTVAGAMALRGWTADYYQAGGEVVVGGKLSLTAGTAATFRSDTGYGFNAPRARTTAGSLVLQGRTVEYDQTESDATFGTGLSLLAKEEARAFTGPRYQTEDPANPGTYDPAAGATTTVANGTLTMSAEDSAEFYQTDGVLTAGGLTLLAPAGSAYYQADVGNGFDAPAPKLVVPAGAVRVQGDSAGFRFAGGVAAVGGPVSVLGKDSAGFTADFGETHDTNYNWTDLYPMVTTGTVTVNGGADAAGFSTFGETFTAHGDVTVKGAAGLSRVYFEDRTGSRVDGNVSVVAGDGFDAFLTWGPLTVGGNVSVDLGSGSNDFETGVEGGTTKVAGNLTFKSGSGSDTYSLARLEVAGTTIVTTGAGADQVYLLGGTKFAGPVTVDAGAGADLVSIATALPDSNNPGGPPAFPAGTVEFDAKATVKLGAGNDRLVLGDATDANGIVTFGPSGTMEADGGPSLGDTFVAVAGQVNLAKVSKTGFELP